MALMEMYLQNLVTKTPVRTGRLLSKAQSDDLRRSEEVEDEHIEARMDDALGIVKKEISGVRGYPFLITHLDEFGRETGIVAAYFACELFRPF